MSYNESGDFNTEETARRRIKQALDLISKFMNDNHLKLNPKKTQFSTFSRKTISADFDPLALSDPVAIPPSGSLIMESDLNFHSHVSVLVLVFSSQEAKVQRCTQVTVIRIID